MMMNYQLLIITLFLTLHSTESSYVLLKQKPTIEDSLKKLLTHADSAEQCTPITIPACKKLGYNNTRLPLNTNSRHLEDVSKHIEMMELTKCSEDFLFFSCMMYNPICFKNHLKQVLPCKSVCQNVRRDCMGVMKKLGYQWPTELNCETLPDYETDVCIRKKSIVSKTEFNKLSTTSPDNNRVDYEPCESRCQTFPHFIRTFRQFKRADYAVAVQYKSKTRTSNGNYKLTFKVLRIYKPGKIPLMRHGNIDLWTDSPCLCAKINFDEKYIILGQESMNKDTHGYRMMLTDDTVIVGKTYHYTKTMKKWKRRYRKYLEREAEELKRINIYDELMSNYN